MMFLEVLGLVSLALLYLFFLCLILKVGLNISFENNHTWWGGLPLWFIWAVFFIFGVPALLYSAIVEFC